MNRFKKGKNASHNTFTEFYTYKDAAEDALKNPEFWKSDRVRQEYVFCFVVETCQRSYERTKEQRDIIAAVKQKIDNIQKNIPLDGTEPFITAEEFAEWNVKYPID